jgi:hypothetical protein
VRPRDGLDASAGGGGILLLPGIEPQLPGRPAVAESCEMITWFIILKVFEGILMRTVIVFHFAIFLDRLFYRSRLKINTCSGDRMESVLGKKLISTQFCPVAKGILNPWAMVPQIFKQSRSNFQILGTSSVTILRSHR